MMVRKSQADELAEDNEEVTRVNVFKVLLPWIPIVVGGALVLGGLKISLGGVEAEQDRQATRIGVLDERQSINGQRIAALEAQVLALQEQVRQLQQRKP